MDRSIVRKKFLDGMKKVYTSLFTDGIEDGIYLYLLNTDVLLKNKVYSESKYRYYREPILLPAHVNLSPEYGEEVEELKNSAVFSIELKSFQEHNIDVTTEEGLHYLRQSIIQYKDVFYTVGEINRSIFVEDVFLFLKFQCEEDKDIGEIQIADYGK